jgi:hypothetical protein
MPVYGYGRVSTEGQTLAGQEATLGEASERRSSPKRSAGRALAIGRRRIDRARDYPAAVIDRPHGADLCHPLAHLITGSPGHF